MKSALEKIASAISASVFLDELSFDRNQFQPRQGSWAELADLVLWLGTSVVFVQVKERAADAAHDNASLAAWFESRVVGDAVKQLEETHRFVKEHSTHVIQNRRGDTFSIGDIAKAQPVNVVLYGSLRTIPKTVGSRKIVVHPLIGTVHLIDVGDFREILERTVTPGELLSYLTFREMHLRAIPDHAEQKEKWLFGRYLASPQIVSELYDVRDRDYETVVDALVDDTQSLDIRSYLSSIRDSKYASLGGPRGYYDVLIEVGWLRRAAMREFKKRLRLCAENASKRPIGLPYRLTNIERDCAFVLAISDTLDVRKRQEELAIWTALAKYDAKARRGLGVIVADVGNDQIVADWCWLEVEWEHNQEIDLKLLQFYPFRPVRPAVLYDYYTQDN